MTGPPLVLDSCTICFDQLTATWPDRVDVLTPLEAEFLKALQQADGKPVSQTTALQTVWGYHASVHSRAVALCVTRLRRKLEVDPANPQWLLTVRGRGYRLHVPPVATQPHTDLVAGAQRCLDALSHVGAGERLAWVQRHWEPLASLLTQLPVADAVVVATALGECSWRLDVSHPPEPLWRLFHRIPEGRQRQTLRLALARVCWQSGATDSAEELVAHVLDTMHPRASEDPTQWILAGVLGAWTARLAGHLDMAQERATQAYQEAKRWGDRSLIGAAADQVASALYDKGAHQQAEMWFEDALRALEQTDDAQGIGLCRNNYGVLLYETGRVDDALPNIHAAISSYEQDGHLLDASVAMANLAMMLLTHQRWDDAEVWVMKAEQLQRRQGGGHGLTHVVRIQGRIAADRGELQSAKQLFLRSAHLAKQAGLSVRQAYALLDLGWVHHALHEDATAAIVYDEAYGLLNTANSKPGLALLTLWRACLEQSRVRMSEALRLLVDTNSPLLPVVRGETESVPSYAARRALDVAGTPPIWVRPHAPSLRDVG